MNDTLPSTKICEKHENGKLEKYKKCYKINYSDKWNDHEK